MVLFFCVLISLEYACKPIIRGKKFPYDIGYSAIIIYPKNGHEQLFCGGTFISPNIVLVASHCIDEKNMKSVTVYYSHEISIYKSENKKEYDFNFKGITFKSHVKKFIKMFEGKFIDPYKHHTDDIGLLFLDKSALICSKKKSVMVALLPFDIDTGKEYFSSDEIVRSKNMIVTGNGYNEKGEIHNETRLLIMTKSPELKKSKYFGGDESYLVYTNLSGLPSISKGDSGSGLVLWKKNFPYIIGVSFSGSRENEHDYLTNEFTI
uniref:Peptidase S1 domain-containing protein n=1 Tax=Strongyloides stercoralis TaxID=6248 RepID=A0AAF5D361_STRER